MSFFKAEWESEAENQLAALPSRVAAAVMVACDDLAEDPVGLSRPARPPFLGRGQEYECVVAGRSVVFVFQYNANEEVIHILNVSVI